MPENSRWFRCIYRLLTRFKVLNMSSKAEANNLGIIMMIFWWHVYRTIETRSLWKLQPHLSLLSPRRCVLRVSYNLSVSWRFQEVLRFPASELNQKLSGSLIMSRESWCCSLDVTEKSSEIIFVHRLMWGCWLKFSPEACVDVKTCLQSDSFKNILFEEQYHFCIFPDNRCCRSLYAFVDEQLHSF